MRCIWSTSLRRALFTSRPSAHRCIEKRALFKREFHVQYARLSETNTQTPWQHAGSLTSAELSRAAAKAVRMSVKSQDLKMANVIVDSLRRSVLRNDISLAKIPGFQSQPQQFDRIHLNKPVPPRLSAHTLLHCLIRTGSSTDAYRLADLMMRQGIRLRSTSLHAVTTALLASPPSNVATPDPPPLDLAQVLSIRPNTMTDPCTRQAVQLFLHAREYRQRRSKSTYQALINACLLQGEIIVASLLFVMVVKDWQLRKQFSAHLRTDADSSTLPPPLHGESVSSFRARLKYLRSENLTPQPQTMHSILFSINDTLSRDPQDEPDLLAFQASLQALANLAVLLDERKLPFPQLGPLIRSMYLTPRVKSYVWIVRKGVGNRLEAHPFFHRVLERFINSILDNPAHNLPLPDRHAYNAMLTYAVRHRCSPPLAREILEQMKARRWNISKPDLVSYNTLLRSGTLVRSSKVANQTLDELRQGTIPIVPRSNPDESAVNEHPSLVSAQQEGEKLGQPEFTDAQLPESRPLQVDPFTLTTFISHLTSTGRPHLVADILFQVLPELAIIDHPSWGSLSPTARRHLRKLSREKCIQRAATYGPYFYTCILNALRKAGRTGLAERVWHLAKEAERVSWIPRFMPKTGPWCLPVDAYTVMIQCYADEARAGPRQQGRIMRATAEGQASWVPTSNRYVRGWAHLIIKRQKMARTQLCRHTTGRQMGMMLFRSMESGAHAVYKALLKLKHLDNRQWQNVEIPRPDARFFNAALRLSSHHLRWLGRRERVSRAFWRRRFDETASGFAQSGELPKGWNPMLHEIAQEMVDAGFELPLALRYLFVGRWLSRSSRPTIPAPLDRQPYFFGPLRPDSTKLHRLPTVNRRGLIFKHRRRIRRATSPTDLVVPSEQNNETSVP